MRGTPTSYFDYSGGRNTQSAPYLLSENECRDQLNTHTSLSGDIEKRSGFVTLADLSAEPAKATAVHTLFPANASAKTLLGVVKSGTEDRIVKITSAGAVTVLKSGLTAATRWHWAQADVNAGQGPIFGMNGVDTPQRWNGAAASTSDWVATTGTVPPQGRFLTYFAERLWCAEGSRLLYSGLTGSSPDPLSWDADNYVDLEPNDGQEITGIGVVGSYLMVFKPRKTFKVYDTINGANQQISSQIGCVAHRSIVQTPAGLLFLSEDQGVCRTDGNSVKPFSDEIQPDLREVASSPSTQALAAGTLLGRRYYLSVSMGGVRNDHTLEYDLIKGSWWLHDCSSNQFALLDPAGAPKLFSADTAFPRASEAFVDRVFTDNGQPFAGGSYWVSPWYAWGVGGRGANPHVVKRITEIRTDGVGNWSASLASDFEEVFDQMEGETWSTTNAEEGDPFEEEGGLAFEEEGEAEPFEEAPEANVSIHYLTPGLGRSHSIKYENDDDADFKIYSTTIALIGRTN